MPTNPNQLFFSTPPYVEHDWTYLKQVWICLDMPGCALSSSGMCPECVLIYLLHVWNVSETSAWNVSETSEDKYKACHVISRPCLDIGGTCLDICGKYLDHEIYRKWRNLCGTCLLMFVQVQNMDGHVWSMCWYVSNIIGTCLEQIQEHGWEMYRLVHNMSADVWDMSETWADI